jgi:hypothetical protein
VSCLHCFRKDNLMNDSRASVRALQQRLFPGQCLPEICLALRRGCNGSGEPWAEADVRATLDLLQRALATWEEETGPAFARRFDEAVRNLVQATIAEVEMHLLPVVL